MCLAWVVYLCRARWRRRSRGCNSSHRRLSRSGAPMVAALVVGLGAAAAAENQDEKEEKEEKQEKQEGNEVMQDGSGEG